MFHNPFQETHPTGFDDCLNVGRRMPRGRAMPAKPVGSDAISRRRTWKTGANDGPCEEDHGDARGTEPLYRHAGPRHSEAQADRYAQYIRSKVEWEFVKVYTDEGTPYGQNAKAREHPIFSVFAGFWCSGFVI